tara:strand:- start:386 stop:625 length:240 start_codon:yes stop_codon:yes gene_type:complete
MESNNKLIAEFMGVGKHYEAQSSNMFNQYHTDWNRLMPVIDKCYQEHMSKHIADAVMTCNIYEVYQAVVEFIKEYNQNN